MTVQGSKNAVLPILASTILIAGKTTLRNCPDISDVDCMCRILQKIGATVTKTGHEICVDASGALQSRLPAEEVVRMRSSIVLTGALLGRLGQASFCDPGGCVIGDRPIDLHLKAFARFGCQIRREDDNFLTVFAKRLNGVQIRFPFSSVGATQNAILCAVCAKGETVLTGCAKEPEVVSLCRFLNGAGAKIEGAGSKTIRIEGVKKLCSTEFSIDADRIVAGTCLIGVLAAGGEAFLRQGPTGQLTAGIAVAKKMGAQIVPDSEGLLVKRAGRLVSPLLLETDVYPGYPTDLQSPMLTALCCAEGNCMVSERVFNGRFGVHEQLNRMGAAIVAGQTSAEVTGGRKLHGERVFAKELRGGAALVLAGLFFDLPDAASIAVIGAADGPTAIFVANTLGSKYLGAIMVAAYSYMALVPIVQPPVIRLCTTKKERLIRMPYQKGSVSKTTKILFPIVVTMLAGLVAPASVALVGFLMFGNLLRECGVLNALSETAQNVLANLITIVLGLTVAGQMTADKFVRPDTLLILALGLVAFIFDTAGGVFFAKLLNLFLPEGKKINPMIGAAGISAFPMSGRVVNQMGLAEDNQNFLLMYSISVNVSGQIASVIAGGLILTLMSSCV